MIYAAVLFLALGIAPTSPADSDLVIVRNELRRYYVRPLADSIIMRPTIDSIVAGCDKYTFAANADKTSYLEDAGGLMTRDQGLDIDPDSTGLFVSKVRHGSPSYAAGICIGDRVIMINGDSVHDKTWIEAMNIVIGASSDEIRFALLRNGKPLTIDVHRNISVNSKVTSMMDNHIGYVRIEGFTRSTGMDIDRIFSTFMNERIRRVVIDLRSNRGGMVGPAVDLLENFAGEGDTLYAFQYKPDSTEMFTAESQGIFYGKPLEVLVGRNTASAAEIVALGVKGNDYGYVLGDTTYGKGKMQVQIDLPSGRWFQYTRAVVKGPKGLCIDREHGTGGLAPDLPFEMGTFQYDTMAVVAAHLPDIAALRVKYPAPDTAAIDHLRSGLPEHLKSLSVYYIIRSVWNDLGQLYWVSVHPRYARWKNTPQIAKSK